MVFVGVLWSEFVWSVGLCVLSGTGEGGGFLTGPFIQSAGYGDVGCDVFYGVSGSAVWGARLLCH